MGACKTYHNLASQPRAPSRCARAASRTQSPKSVTSSPQHNPLRRKRPIKSDKPVRRTLPATPGDGLTAFANLSQGPTPEETAAMRSAGRFPTNHLSSPLGIDVDRNCEDQTRNAILFQGPTPEEPAASRRASVARRFPTIHDGSLRERGADVDRNCEEQSTSTILSQGPTPEETAALRPPDTIPTFHDGSLLVKGAGVRRICVQ